MKNLEMTINGTELAARWNIETVDLLYIMMNHGLNVVDQADNEVDVGDVLEDFRSRKDASVNIFLLSEVKNVENKFKVDGKITHAETITGKELMTRWKMHDAQIFREMIISGLAAIDPFGYELDSNRIYPLIYDNTLYVSDLLFRLSDIEEFESENEDLIPSPKKQDEVIEIAEDNPLAFMAYGYNTICLEKQEDYDLPFKVWGYIYPNMNSYRETSKGSVPVLDGYLD